MTKCGEGHEIPERGDEPVAERRPCAVCGSLNRMIGRSIDDRLTIRDGVGTELRRAGSKKVVQKTYAGWTTSSDGTLVRKTQTRDHEADVYQESVWTEDGTLLHHDSSSLTEHTGRGSDKPELRAARDALRRERTSVRALRKVRIDALWRARATKPE
jgi:hypothetical protein